MRQSPPLADVFRVVFDYLRAHHDVILFGSHAVNVYVDPPRMTGDIDVMSDRAATVAEEIRQLLADTFHIAVRIRTVAGGRGFRVYQTRAGQSRQLVDVRQIERAPATLFIDGVRVMGAGDLTVAKLESYAARRNTPKGLTDKADLHRLLGAVPSLREPGGTVDMKLETASAAANRAWDEILSEDLDPDDDDVW